MGNTWFLLGLFACFHAVRAATPGNKTASSVPAAILTVDVMQDGIFVAPERISVTMYMHAKLTRVFRISVLCDGVMDEICVNMELSERTEYVISLVTTPNVCFKCIKENESLPEKSTILTETPDKTTNSDRITTKFENDAWVERLVNVTVKSGLIGVAGLEFKVANLTQGLSTSNMGHTPGSLKIEYRVLRSPSVLDLVFVVCVYCLEIIEMLVFGTQLDFATVKKTFRRPLYPLIGFVCQYVGMPLIAFSIAKANSDNSGLASLGIFVAGICPGGGGSNIYTYLLDGDLSLSITMTAISTIMSLAMMPMWLYTLGQEFLDNDTAEIPYTDILVTLSIILVPLSLGLLIQSKQPRVATLVQKVLTGVITVIALVLIVTGVYANLYIFQLMTLKIVFIGCALPYVGFFLGGTVALLIGLPAETVKAIAIETGMQNTGVGFLLLYNSLSEPYGDIASVAPVSSEIMSPIPPLIIAIVYIFHKKCCSKYKSVPQKGALEASSSDINENGNDMSVGDSDSLKKKHAINKKCSNASNGIV